MQLGRHCAIALEVDIGLGVHCPRDLRDLALGEDDPFGVLPRAGCSVLLEVDPDLGVCVRGREVGVARLLVVGGWSEVDRVRGEGCEGAKASIALGFPEFSRVDLVVALAASYLCLERALHDSPVAMFMLFEFPLAELLQLAPPLTAPTLSLPLKHHVLPLPCRVRFDGALLVEIHPTLSLRATSTSSDTNTPKTIDPAQAQLRGHHRFGLIPADFQPVLGLFWDER